IVTTLAKSFANSYPMPLEAPVIRTVEVESFICQVLRGIGRSFSRPRSKNFSRRWFWSVSHPHVLCLHPCNAARRISGPIENFSIQRQELNNYEYQQCRRCAT